MNCWNTIPGLERELLQVAVYLEKFTEDRLHRQPLSSILKTAFSEQGKLLRPALILLTSRLGSGYPECSDRICRLAALVELTHAASLIHDDIIDDSPMRRGKPTVQASYGKDMAVYAGDFILSKILFYLMEYGMTQAGKILAQSIEDMCNGEIAQYEAQFNTETTEEKYFSCILNKTAAMFSAACKLGAMESGCNEETTARMGHFGHILGVLFQLRDDLLDYTSSENKEGKPVQSDFKRGIYTLPVLHTFRNADTGSELREIALRVQNGDSDSSLLRMEALVAHADGVGYAKQAMKRYVKKAQGLLDVLPPGRERAVLDTLVTSLAVL